MGSSYVGVGFGYGKEVGRGRGSFPVGQKKPWGSRWVNGSHLLSHNRGIDSSAGQTDVDERVRQRKNRRTS